jgi:hypothetical protein
VGGPTEVARGPEQDLTVTYLRTTQRVPKDTFLTTFGEASIIRASEPEGKQLETLYGCIQRTPSLQKCQYTVKAPMGTPKDHIWIVPHPDNLILLSQKPPKQLVQALSNPSILQGHGHMAQHSCYKRSECHTSTNARLCLIFQSSGNDEEDQCMGVVVVSTRPISQGEQIFISYSGDETIEDTWGEVFRCYCCHCQKSCPVRGGGPLESKRKEPVSHQGIRESESEQSSKKARFRFHKPDKRKRKEEETLDLEPINEKRDPPVTQATPYGLGDAHRTKGENHTESEQHSSLIDRATKQLCSTAGEDNDHTTTAAPERMTVKTRDTDVSDMQQNFNPENAGDEGGANDEDKDDPVDGHRQDRPTKYDIIGRCPCGDDPDDDFRSDTENRDNAHRSTSERSSITDDHGEIQRSNKYKLGDQDLNGDNHRSEHQESLVGLDEDQGGEQSSDIKVRCPGATDHDREISPSNRDPSDGQRPSTGEMRNERGSSTDESDGAYLGSVGGQEALCNPHPLNKREDNALDKDEYLPQVIGDEQDLGVKGQGGEPHLN